MADFAEIRAEAKELGINAYQKGKEQLEQEIAAAKGESVKKGAASWKPARMLDVRNKQPGLKYFWADKDPQQLEKKLAEGWMFADRTTGEHIDPKTVGGGKTPDGAYTYRDNVLLVLPEDQGEARKAYYQKKAREQIEGVNRRAKEEAKKVDPNAEVHNAKLVIE